MHEFFRGWRRKAGLVTLAMALALMAAWYRSYIADDGLTIVVSSASAQYIGSCKGLVYWIPDEGQYEVSSIVSGYSYLISNHVLETLDHQLTHTQCAWSGPYWSLILPLTLLSAWLLLTKPRPAKSAKESNRA